MAHIPDLLKPRNHIFVVLCIQIVLSIGCTRHENHPTQFHYFTLDGLNRLQQPAALGAGTAYIHHALTKEGELAPPQECGLGALEDAARAVLVYLRYAEMTGDTASIASARALLLTLVHLQKPDGLFYDWLDAQGRPTLCNVDGVNGFGYPEVRAMWALAAGAKFFARSERAFAERLHQAFWRSFVHLDSCLARYGQFREKDGRQFPQWLPFGSGADAASELILAFDAIWQSGLNNAQRQEHLEQAMRQFAEGIVCMQAGDAEEFPFGAHLAYESYWHSWGNCAMQALALSGAKFNDAKLIDAAVAEAAHFVPYLQKVNFAHSFNVVEARQNASRIDHFPQMPADIRPLVTGLIELSRVTGSKRYARRAGEIALWFRGDNAAREAVYVAKAGLAKDRIQGHNYVVPTLTADATVEALMAIHEVEANRDSRREFYTDVENVFEGKP